MRQIAPCIGCGECCLSGKCRAAELAVGDSDEICPFLRFIQPSFYRCLLVEFESFSELEPLVKELLGIGMGCTNGYKVGDCHDQT